MTWRAGSVDAFSNSLAFEIEDAFQSLVLAENGEPLEPAGERDRRILFAAIAQGVLEYLAANDSQIGVRFTGVGSGVSATIQLPVPRIAVSATGTGSSRTARVTGSDFPSGTVTARWLPGGESGGSTAVGSGGTFALTLARPASIGSGPHAVVARDSQGDELVGRVTL
jgi:hypothetical protein